MAITEIFPQVSLRDLVFIVCKRKWSIALVVLLVLLGAGVWLFIIRDDAYTTTAKVLVRIGQEQATPATVLGTPAPVLGQRSQDVNSEVDILQSTELLAQVVDELHLDIPSPPKPPPAGLLARMRYHLKAFAHDVKEWLNEWMIRIGLRERLTPREKAIYLLSQGLVVNPQRDSNIVVATLTVPFRQHSSIILNTLLEHYLTFRLGLYQDDSVKFFQQQVAKAEADLRRAEDDLQHFENSGDISRLDRQEDLLLTDISEIESKMKDDERAYREAASKVSRLEQELQSKDPNLAVVGEFDRDSYPQAVLRQLTELQRERERLRMTELDNSEHIRNNRDQFNTLAGLLAANLRSVLAEKKAVYDHRKEQLAALDAQLQGLHGKATSLDDRKRHVRVMEDDYLFYRKKFEETSAQQILEQKRIGNVAIVEHATDPLLPTGMRKTTLLGLSFAGAIFAALLWVSLAEFFDHGVYTPEALQEYLKAPVIAVVPRDRRHDIAAAARSQSERRRSLEAYAG